MLISDILIERPGDETAIEAKEASNEGDAYYTLYMYCLTIFNFFVELELLYVSIFVTVKLWPNDKYGFQFAYAVRLNSKWMVKLVGGNWEPRSSDWNPADERVWRKLGLLANLCNIYIYIYAIY